MALRNGFFRKAACSKNGFNQTNGSLDFKAQIHEHFSCRHIRRISGKENQKPVKPGCVRFCTSDILREFSGGFSSKRRIQMCAVLVRKCFKKLLRTFFINLSRFIKHAGVSFIFYGKIDQKCRVCQGKQHAFLNARPIIAVCFHDFIPFWKRYRFSV